MAVYYPPDTMMREDEDQSGSLTDDALDAVGYLARRFGDDRRVLWIGEQLSVREEMLAEESVQLRAYSLRRPALKHVKARARRLQSREINPAPKSADLIVMTDTGLISWPFEQLAERLGESLSPDGTVVMGVATDGLDLDALDTVLGRVFHEHRLLSCRPIGGWTVVDVAADATALHVDDALLRAAEPAASVLIVVASHGTLTMESLIVRIL